MDKETKQILTNILKDSEEIIKPDVQSAIHELLEPKNKCDGLGNDDIFPKEKGQPNPIEDNEAIGIFHDYRLKSVKLKNFRSVPASGRNKPYGISFEDAKGNPISTFLVGRNSSGKTTIYSALEYYYVSTNSIAKDIYKDVRNDKETDKKEKYLTYGFGQLKTGIESDNPELEVETVSGIIIKRLNDKTRYCSLAPFCSEYDLHQLAEKGEDLKYYILDQLGYGELRLLKDEQAKKIQKIKKDIEFSKNMNWSELDVSDMEEVITYFVRYADKKKAKDQLNRIGMKASLFDKDNDEHISIKKTHFFKNGWKIYENLSSTENSKNKGGLVEKFNAGTKVLTEKSDKKEVTEVKSNKTAKDQLAKLKKMYELLANGLKQCADEGEKGMIEALTVLINIKNKSEQRILTEEIIEQAEKEIKILEKIISLIEKQEMSIINDFITKRFKMIVDILKIFSNNEGELFIKWEKEDKEKEDKEKEDKEKLTIKVKGVSLSKKTFEATPQEFYNSFRYKLYAVSFKIALAFMEMKLKNIRVPIVIDDVFNASDFENNIRLEYFVYNIYLAYSTMNFKEPLQIILLTHDEMVQAAFRKGANMVVVKEKELVEEELNETKNVVIRENEGKEENKDGNKEKMYVELMPDCQDTRRFQCGRLFNWNYAVKLEEELEKNNNGDDVEMTILSDFYNLYIPN